MRNRTEAGLSRNGERRNIMRTVKWNPIGAACLAALGSVIVLAGGAYAAGISSTNPAAIVVFPELKLDSDYGQDTSIQLTNTADAPVNLRCFYVNANGHCLNSDQVCNPNYTGECIGGVPCVPGWQETDFAIRLTSKQPITWSLSSGLATLPLVDRPGP